MRQVLFSITLAEDAEDPLSHNEEEEFFQEYHVYQFKDQLGMTYSEFMELTRARKDLLIEFLRERVRLANEMAARQKEDIKNAGIIR